MNDPSFFGQLKTDYQLYQSLIAKFLGLMIAVQLLALIGTVLSAPVVRQLVFELMLATQLVICIAALIFLRGVLRAFAFTFGVTLLSIVFAMHPLLGFGFIPFVGAFDPSMANNVESHPFFANASLDWMNEYAEENEFFESFDGQKTQAINSNMFVEMMWVHGIAFFSAFSLGGLVATMCYISSYVESFKNTDDSTKS